MSPLPPPGWARPQITSICPRELGGSSLPAQPRCFLPPAPPSLFLSPSQNAVNVPRDFEGCSTLRKYFGQLHYLQSRIPMGAEQEAAVPIAW